MEQIEVPRFRRNFSYDLFTSSYEKGKVLFAITKSNFQNEKETAKQTY